MAYVPKFESQTDEGLRPPFTNCNPASAAMLIDGWTYGAIDTSDVAIRQASGVSPAEGMNFAAINLGVRALFPQLGELLYSEHIGFGTAPMTWAELRTHLSSGGGAIACGLYGDLPLDLRRWSPSFTGGHATYVTDYRPADETLLWMDPLGGLDYAGERISLGTLWEYIWKTGTADENVRVTAAHSFSNPRPPEPVAPPTTPPFIDVPLNHPHVADITWAKEQGLMTGYGDGRFGPGDPVTRAQLAAVLRRASV